VSTVNLLIDTIVEASTNANLGSLSVNNGTLSPAFNAGTTSYSVSVPNTTTSITVTAAVADTGKANPAQSPGTLGSPVSLDPGGNTITVTVTAEDKITTKSYTIMVTRETASTSTNANLGSLSVSDGTLSPAFNAGTTAYTVSVPNTITSITVTAAVADTGKANPAQSPGTLGSPVSLEAGTPKVITIKVTAENGTTKDYTITVTRAEAAAVTSSVTVTITKANEVINLEKSSSNDLSKKNGDTLGITAPAEYDDYDYQVDGVAVISSKEIEISAESYGLGTHSVLLIFYKNGIQYGSEVTFKVVK
jgi:hypothetical protein